MAMELEDIIKENEAIEDAARSLRTPIVIIDGVPYSVPDAQEVLTEYDASLEAIVARREKLRLAVRGHGRGVSRGRPPKPRAPSVPVAAEVQGQLRALSADGRVTVWGPKDWATWATTRGLKPRSVARAVKKAMAEAPHE